MSGLERCDREIEEVRAMGDEGPAWLTVLGAEDWEAEKRMILKAPFPWFGGKSRASTLVWDRLGNVPNYIEPFAGSLAVLLSRPHPGKLETVNDADCYLANFWRSLHRDPTGLAEYSDWPVNEADLHARHLWLVNQTEFRERMKTDPEYFDLRIAGWWCWGLCQWIGSGWCSHPEWTGRTNAAAKPRGISGIGGGQAPSIRQMGVHRRSLANGIPPPQSASATALSHVNSHRSGGAPGNPPRKLAKLGHNDPGGRLDMLSDYFRVLSRRLRRVRVCCGDWSRIITPAVTVHNGLTGVLLDPPYASERAEVYSQDSTDVAHAVREWAIANGDNPELRIALCGYEGEHEMPTSWECVQWKANGGYANANAKADSAGKQNARKERIWFSPHCLRPTLFSYLDFEEEATAWKPGSRARARNDERERR